MGPIRNRKTGQNFHQNQKTRRKIAQNRKNAENNDQNCKFVIFSPSTLDTTAKILALGTIQCPCYTACSANLIRIIPKKFLQCSTKGIASSIVSVSFEGETFVTRDELKKVRTIRQFALKNRITAFLLIKTETRMSKREKTVNRSGYQNRKTGDFECKNRKTDLKSDQNLKTEKHNVPLQKKWEQGPGKGRKKTFVRKLHDYEKPVRQRTSIKSVNLI